METLKCPKCGGAHGPTVEDKDAVAVYWLEGNPLCHRCFTAWVTANIQPMQPVENGDYQSLKREDIRFEPWLYDERSGMVAVYSGERRNCLDLPSESFIYLRYWKRKQNEAGFEVIEEDKRIGKLISAIPDMRDALSVAAEALALPTSEAGKAKALATVRGAIAKAEGRDHKTAEK